MSEELQLWVIAEEIEPDQPISGARSSEDIGGGFGTQSLPQKIVAITDG